MNTFPMRSTLLQRVRSIRRFTKAEATVAALGKTVGLKDACLIRDNGTVLSQQPQGWVI